MGHFMEFRVCLTSKLQRCRGFYPFGAWDLEIHEPGTSKYFLHPLILSSLLSSSLHSPPAAWLRRWPLLHRRKKHRPFTPPRALVVNRWRGLPRSPVDPPLSVDADSITAVKAGNVTSLGPPLGWRVGRGWRPHLSFAVLTPVLPMHPVHPS